MLSMLPLSKQVDPFAAALHFTNQLRSGILCWWRCAVLGPLAEAHSGMATIYSVSHCKTAELLYALLVTLSNVMLYQANQVTVVAVPHKHVLHQAHLPGCFLSGYRQAPALAPLALSQLCSQPLSAGHAACVFQ